MDLWHDIPHRCAACLLHPCTLLQQPQGLSIQQPPGPRLRARVCRPSHTRSTRPHPPCPPAGAALVALYGFAVAAMWIALFANEIVGMLQFYGMLRCARRRRGGLFWGRSSSWGRPAAPPPARPCSPCAPHLTALLRCPSRPIPSRHCVGRSKVDPAVVGVTILAWGNSLMDYLNNTVGGCDGL